MSLMKTRVRYKYDPKDRAWLVDLPEVKGAHTFGRTLRQARARAREVWALMQLDTPEAEAFEQAKMLELVEEFSGLRATLATVRRAKQAHSLLAHAEKVEEEKTRAAVLKAANLFDPGDIAELLGISRQRVQRLSGAPRKGK